MCVEFNRLTVTAFQMEMGLPLGRLIDTPQATPVSPYPSQNPLLTGSGTELEPLACSWALPLELNPGAAPQMYPRSALGRRPFLSIDGMPPFSWAF